MKFGRSLFAFAGFGVAIAVLGWRVGGAGERPPATPSAAALDVENEIATLRSEVEQLKRQPRFVLGGGPLAAPAVGDTEAGAVPPSTGQPQDGAAAAVAQ